MEKQLGKIKSVFFGFEDHKILSFMISFDFGGTGQGFGGYALDTFDKSKNRRVGCAAGTDLILKLLNLFGVNELSEIEGRHCYALRDKSFGPIVGLQTTEPEGDKMFLIQDWQKEWFSEGE